MILFFPAISCRPKPGYSDFEGQRIESENPKILSGSAEVFGQRSAGRRLCGAIQLFLAVSFRQALWPTVRLPRQPADGTKGQCSAAEGFNAKPRLLAESGAKLTVEGSVQGLHLKGILPAALVHRGSFKWPTPDWVGG